MLCSWELDGCWCNSPLASLLSNCSNWGPNDADWVPRGRPEPGPGYVGWCNHVETQERPGPHQHSHRELIIQHKLKLGSEDRVFSVLRRRREACQQQKEWMNDFPSWSSAHKLLTIPIMQELWSPSSISFIYTHKRSMIWLWLCALPLTVL